MQAINRMDWSELKHEYDLDAKRLLPWEGVVAPFGGAWCVVRPGTRSLPHAHMEREIFICIDGKADVVLDGKPHSIGKGDVVAVPPGSDHYIQNNNDDDFHMYCIFWDKDAATKYLNEEVL